MNAIYPLKETLVRAEKNLKNRTFKLTNLIDPAWKTNFVSIEDLIKPIDLKLLTFINVNGPIDIEKIID